MLGALFSLEELPAGSKVYEQGDSGEKFYIILDGCVSVSCKISESFTQLRCMKKDEWFGEVALILGLPQASTVQCVDDSMFLTLTREKFNQFLSIAPELKEQFDRIVLLRTADVLSNIPFFRDLKENKPWSKLDILCAIFHFESFTVNQKLFSVGDVGDKFYIVLNGSVSIEAVENGVKLKDRVLGQNDWFGEMALLEDGLRCATATSVTNTLCLVINGVDFRQVLLIAPELLPLLQEKIESYNKTIAHDDIDIKI